MNLNEILERLWEDYTEQNPHAKQVYDLFMQKGEYIKNDHIAFRTFNDPRINIDVLSRIFLENGYREKGSYDFPEKNLFAKHFEYPGGDKPRVFISQLLLDNFRDELKTIAKNQVDKIPTSILSSGELIFSGNLWNPLYYATYEKLREESEYAAWFYVNGSRANHFTINVNALKNFEDIKEVNQLLKDNGFLLNDSGGEIKGSPEILLEQSSIRAGKQKVNFKEGVYKVPSCYYEFAKRYTDKNGELFSGFIAKSADKIFESTDYYDKKK